MTQVRLYGVNDLRVDQVTIPEPGARDVLVKIDVCGICGSDLLYAADGGALGPVQEPLPLGHESAGVITAIGSAVHDIKVGQRVVINPDRTLIGNGGPDGCFANYTLVRDAQPGVDLHVIPDHLSSETAALVEPLSVALHGINRSGAQIGHKVVVFGCGAIGLSAIIGLRHRGITDIVAVDILDTRLKLATRFGARVTLNSARDDLYETLRREHGAEEKFGIPMVGTDIFIDAAGVAAVLEQTVIICKSHARIAIVAVHKKPAALDLRMLLAKELEIVGAMAYPADEFAEIIAMLSSGEVDVSALISHRFPLRDFPQAFAAAKDAAHSLKVMVEMT